MNKRGLKRKIFHGRSLDGHEDMSRDSRVEKCDQNDGGGVEVEAPSEKKHNSSPQETNNEVLPASFDFHVFEKEGIKLNVDLDSSPSDYWNGRIKKELSRGENAHRIGSSSLLQDLGFLGDSSRQRRRSVLWNTDLDQINDRNGQNNSCTSLEVPKDDLAWFNQQEEDDSSIMSAPRSMAVNVAGSLKKGQLAVSAKADHSKANQSTASAKLNANVFESHAKNGSKEILDSEVTNTSLIKSLCASVGNFVSDPILSGHRSSKPANVISEEFTLPSSYLFLNPSVCPSVTGSVELQITEVASSPGENDGLDLADPKKSSDLEQGGLVDSSDLNLDNDGNKFPSVKEERERGKIVKRRESSKCLRIDDPLKKSGPDSRYRKSKFELHRKRKPVNIKDKGSSGNPCGRILRSMKQIAGKGLPRRSMRLISK